MAAPKGESLRRPVKQLLQSLSNAQRIASYCVACGSACSHIEALFWLDGDDERFTLWLPVCTDCNPDLVSRAVPQPIWVV